MGQSVIMLEALSADSSHWSVDIGLRLVISSCSPHFFFPQSFSRVQPFATLWIVVGQAPLSLEFSRQEYWTG